MNKYVSVIFFKWIGVIVRGIHHVHRTQHVMFHGAFRVAYMHSSWVGIRASEEDEIRLPTWNETTDKWSDG